MVRVCGYEYCSGLRFGVITGRGAGITASVCNSVCVSVSVRERISETTRPIIATFVHYTYGCGSVFYWRRRDILSTSGFVDGVDQGYAMQ